MECIVLGDILVQTLRVDSDHNQVVGNLGLELKKLQKKRATGVDITNRRPVPKHIEARDIVNQKLSLNILNKIGIF